MSYSTCIKNLRQKQNMTQNEAANAIGVSSSAWKKYETGKRTPRDDIKIKIAALLDSSVQTIFFADARHEM